MRKDRDSLFLWAIIVLVIGLTTIPYLYAISISGTEHVFGGFLLNPMDGYTYLAKMYQGWEGNWRFTLPYTAEPGRGAYLNVLYVFLGHLARLINLPLILVFHLGRLSAAILMLLALFRFFSTMLVEKRLVRSAFLLVALGSGLGWLAVVFNAFTADFWVAEA